ncbi:MAG: hypothetical protein ABSF64_23835 [Bryobacteraceae bacterium]|jgi:hypothetical protein
MEHRNRDFVDALELALAFGAMRDRDFVHAAPRFAGVMRQIFRNQPG